MQYVPPRLPPQLHAGMAQKPALKLIWTYTMLDAYENCNFKGYRKYLAPERIPYVEGPAQAWGNKTHKALRDRIAHGEKLPKDMEQWEWMAAQLLPQRPMTEWKLGIRADGSSCRFHDCEDGDGRGTLDVAIVKGTVGVLFDYKTSSKPREDPRELAIQALLLKAKHPELQRIIGHYVWLADNRVGKAHDVSDTQATWRRVQSIVANIRTKWAADFWPKNENPLCPWCEVPNDECEFRRPIPSKR